MTDMRTNFDESGQLIRRQGRKASRTRNRNNYGPKYHDSVSGRDSMNEAALMKMFNKYRITCPTTTADLCVDDSSKADCIRQTYCKEIKEENGTTHSPKSINLMTYPVTKNGVGSFPAPRYCSNLKDDNRKSTMFCKKLENRSKNQERNNLKAGDEFGSTYKTKRTRETGGAHRTIHNPMP